MWHFVIRQVHICSSCFLLTGWMKEVKKNAKNIKIGDFVEKLPYFAGGWARWPSRPLPSLQSMIFSSNGPWLPIALVSCLQSFHGPLVGRQGAEPDPVGLLMFVIFEMWVWQNWTHSCRATPEALVLIVSYYSGFLHSSALAKLSQSFFIMTGSVFLLPF